MRKPKKKNDPFATELLLSEKILWQVQPALTIFQLARISYWDRTIVVLLVMSVLVIMLLFHNLRLSVLFIPLLIAWFVSFNIEIRAYREIRDQRYAITNLRLLTCEKHQIQTIPIHTGLSISKDLTIYNLPSLNFFDGNRKHISFRYLSDGDEVYKLIYVLQSELKQEAVLS